MDFLTVVSLLALSLWGGVIGFLMAKRSARHLESNISALRASLVCEQNCVELLYEGLEIAVDRGLRLEQKGCRAEAARRRNQLEDCLRMVLATAEEVRRRRDA